jgi:integrase
MKPNTLKTKTSMLRRLKQAGFDPKTVVQGDYPLVKERLGWKESTFKAALKYIGGKEHGDLFEGFRDYIPTPEEQATIERELGDAGILLCYLGCRFSELWRIEIQDGNLRVLSGKGSDHISISVVALPGRVAEAAIRWVSDGSRASSPRYIRRLWEGLRQEGSLPSQCVPHTFRHKLITTLIQQGVNIAEVAKTVGHRDIKTTYRYVHVNPTAQADARNRAYASSTCS